MRGRRSRFKRNADYVYLPTKGRISSFTVTDWRAHSFTVCKTITSDTPVEYREPQDLRMSPATASLIPKHNAVDVGFSVPGHVMRLLKCLEGIKQAANIWFKKNKWAFNKSVVSRVILPSPICTHITRCRLSRQW